MALRVKQQREQLGLTQQALASAIGVSRQSLSAIEAGHAVPSVAISLRLARALGSSVEALFGETASEEVSAELVDACAPGARVVLGSVRERWIAHPTGRGSAGDPQQAYAADGFVRALSGRRRAQVELSRAPAEVRANVLVGGCAPGLSVLADRLNGASGPGRFRALIQSNTAALRSLSAGQVHVAGVHFPMLGPSEIARSLARHLPTSRAEVFALARWEAGLVVAKGNPHRIRDVRALASPKLRVALREVGSGARQQLERMLRKAGEEPRALVQHALDVRTHMEVAYAVSLGAADAGFAIRGAALALSLDFVPLVEERFDLIVPDDLVSDPRLSRLFDTLASAHFRRELDTLGYDASGSGERIVEVSAP